MKKDLSKTRSILKITTVFLTFFGLLATSASNIDSNNAKAPNYRAPLNLKNEIVPTDFEEVSGSDLVARVTTCTATPLTRRISVRFESKAISAFSPQTEDTYYVVDDPNYTGERSDPFKEPQDGKNLSGYTYYAKANNDAQKLLCISNVLRSGSKFNLVNSKIVSHAMYTLDEDDDVEENKDRDSYKNLEAIYICDGIQTVESEAFINVPDTVTIKCVANEKPAGWADDWTDAKNVLWGQELDSSLSATVSQNGGATSFGEAKDYILGYKGSEEYKFDSYPLTVSYKKKHADGSETIEYQEIPTKHKTNPYDAVGTRIFGNTNSFDVTIELEKGEDIVMDEADDPSPFKFYNIFNAKRLYTNKTAEWPTETINSILTEYEVPTSISGMEDGFIPKLAGDGYFYQLFQGETDDYLTIAHEFSSEEEANALLNTYKEMIESFEVDKEVFGSQEDLKYTYLSEKEERNGSVYKLFFEKEEQPINIYVQAYVVHNENIGKYEFVTYIFLDRPLAEEKADENGGTTTIYEKDSRTIPFSKKQIAIRPSVFVPDFVEDASSSKNVPCEPLKAGGLKRFKDVIWFNDIFSLKYLSASKFLNYTSLSVSADKVLNTYYAGLIADLNGIFDENGKMVILTLGEDGCYYNGETMYYPEEVRVVGSFKAPSVYMNDDSTRTYAENNLANIIDNKVVFRYTFSSLNDASIVVNYKKKGEIVRATIPVKSPSPVFEIPQDKGNELSFLINNADLDGVDTSAIVSVGLFGATVNIHLFNKETNNIIQNTQKLPVFGNIEILPEQTKKLAFFDINAYLLLFFVALTLIYAALAIALFFYKKNKYKNDEFRRMRPKAYIKSAILGYVGLVLIAAAINFIVLRIGFFNSSIPTYNPIDPFVIIFSIAAAISIGLFIKNFVSLVKLIKKRRETKKLQLDKDVVDDGTN